MWNANSSFYLVNQNKIINFRAANTSSSNMVPSPADIMPIKSEKRASTTNTQYIWYGITRSKMALEDRATCDPGKPSHYRIAPVGLQRALCGRAALNSAELTLLSPRKQPARPKRPPQRRFNSLDRAFWVRCRQIILDRPALWVMRRLSIWQ